MNSRATPDPGDRRSDLSAAEASDVPVHGAPAAQDGHCDEAHGGQGGLCDEAPARTDEASTTVVHTLHEDTRRAQATIVAIDRYVLSVVRTLAAGPGGIREVERRASALGLHRLQYYL